MKESLITAVLSIIGFWGPVAPATPEAAHQHCDGVCETSHDHADAHADAQAEKAHYACPMHPEVTSDAPGRCPKCGMKLELVEDPKPKSNGHVHRFHAAEG